jgi:hypothetical protein
MQFIYEFNLRNTYEFFKQKQDELKIYQAKLKIFEENINQVIIEHFYLK